MGNKTDRRTFLQSAAVGTAATATTTDADNPTRGGPAPAQPAGTLAPVQYPRQFSGRQLAMIAFPLGGIGAGSISLGGRGQLRDWEIFNRPDKGRTPEYAFAALWTKAVGESAQVRVLEAALTPPYQAPAGLGPANGPGLTRLEQATFTGEFPLARIEFQDAQLPVQVSMEAFSPFVPLDADDSGLPVAILRYRIKNPGTKPVSASIASSVENPAA